MNDFFDISDIVDEMSAAVQPVDVTSTLRGNIIDPDCQLRILPAANMFPMIADTDAPGFIALMNDIKAHGVNDPIKITPDGQIVDGRNRIAAIRKIIADGGSAPVFAVEVMHKTGKELDAWVVSTNLHRRHLTTSQRAMLASDMTTATKSTGGAKVAAITVADAATLVNVSPRQVKNATQVKRIATPEVVAAVRAGTKTVAAAQSEATVAKPAAPVTAALPAEDMKALLDMLPRASVTQLRRIKILVDTALGVV